MAKNTNPSHSVAILYSLVIFANANNLDQFSDKDAEGVLQNFRMVSCAIYDHIFTLREAKKGGCVFTSKSPSVACIAWTSELRPFIALSFPSPRDVKHPRKCCDPARRNAILKRSTNLLDLCSTSSSQDIERAVQGKKPKIGNCAEHLLYALYVNFTFSPIIMTLTVISRLKVPPGSNLTSLAMCMKDGKGVPACDLCQIIAERMGICLTDLAKINTTKC